MRSPPRGARNAAADVYRLLTLDAATLKGDRPPRSVLCPRSGGQRWPTGEALFPLDRRRRRDLDVPAPGSGRPRSGDDGGREGRSHGRPPLPASAGRGQIGHHPRSSTRSSVTCRRWARLGGRPAHDGGQRIRPEAGILDIQVTDQNLPSSRHSQRGLLAPAGGETYALSDMTRSASTVWTRPGDDLFPCRVVRS